MSPISDVWLHLGLVENWRWARSVSFIHCGQGHECQNMPQMQQCPLKSLVFSKRYCAWNPAAKNVAMPYIWSNQRDCPCMTVWSQISYLIPLFLPRLWCNWLVYWHTILCNGIPVGLYEGDASCGRHIQVCSHRGGNTFITVITQNNKLVN